MGGASRTLLTPRGHRQTPRMAHPLASRRLPTSRLQGGTRPGRSAYALPPHAISASRACMRTAHSPDFARAPPMCPYAKCVGRRLAPGVKRGGTPEQLCRPPRAHEAVQRGGARGRDGADDGRSAQQHRAGQATATRRRGGCQAGKLQRDDSALSLYTCTTVAPR